MPRFDPKKNSLLMYNQGDKKLIGQWKITPSARNVLQNIWRLPSEYCSLLEINQIYECSLDSFLERLIQDEDASWKSYFETTFHELGIITRKDERTEIDVSYFDCSYDYLHEVSSAGAKIFFTYRENLRFNFYSILVTLPHAHRRLVITNSVVSFPLLKY